MDIFVNLCWIISITFNISILYTNSKKLYKFYKEKKENKIQIKNEIKRKKELLNKPFIQLNLVNQNINSKAIFTSEDAFKLKSFTQNNENSNLHLFFNSLLQAVPKEYLKNFIDKLADLSIEYHSYKEAKIDKGGFVSGVYNCVHNKIDIYFDKDNKVLNHELLHAASSSKNSIKSGFTDFIPSVGIIGEGLNEGYTELLNQRIFNSKHDSYYYLSLFAEQIELFYDDKEKMMKDYFQADLNSLIKQLSQNMSIEEAIDIITDIDLFIYQQDVSLLDYMKLRQKIMNIYERKFIKDKCEKGFVKKKIK